MRATASIPFRLPALRAPLIFGGLLALLAVLIVRSLYLQRFDHDFLQEQGSSRYSRAIEVPAHRGRIVDRYGDPLAISTPVKAIWAWPDKVEATPAELKALADVLEMPQGSLSHKLAGGGEFVYLKRPVAPDVADRIAADVSGGFRLDLVSTEIAPDVLDMLKLTTQKITELKAELPAHLKTVESMLT